MAKAKNATPDPKAKETKPPTKKDDERVSLVRKRLGAAMTATDKNRRNYVEDVKFSCSDDQWPEEVKRARGSKRPALTFNRLNGVVKQIIGDYRQNKMAIKVLPADGYASEQTADILAGLIRNIEAQSNADLAYTNALECSARGGFGYFRVVPEYTGDDVFDQDLVIKPIYNPLTVYFDPSARLITREDARWCIVTEMVDKEAFKAAYPKASLTSFEGGGDDAAEWVTESEIRVAEHFEKKTYTARLGAFSNGMVMEIKDDAEIAALARIGITLVRERQAERTKIVWELVNGAEVLETREYKCRLIPVIPVIGEEVNIEGEVFTRSAIFYAKDAQRMYNYSKTTATEMVALAPKTPFIVTPTQIENHEDEWANLNVSPLPYVVSNVDPEVPGGLPQRVAPTPQPVGELTMALNAADDIKATTGIYDASLGARSNETSGKAIVARQQEGATSTFIFIDNLKQAIEYCGKVLIDWIPVTHDAERVIRVLDLEGNPKTETINQQKYNPLTGVTEVLNSITVGKYDVVVSTGPSFANRKAEMLASLGQLAQAYPPLMQLAGDLLVQSMDFPGADKVAERLKRSMPPEIVNDPDSAEGQEAAAAAQHQAQQQQQMQQQMQQQALQVEQGKIDAENAKSQATIAKAQAEIIKARNDSTQAVSDTRETVAENRPAAPAHPPVTVQFNAEHALGNVADTMQGMAAQHAETAAQTLEAIQQILLVNAQTNQQIAATLDADREQDGQIAAMMATVAQEAVKGNQAVAEAVKELSAVMKAPRVAVRDRAGNIVSSEIRV